MNTGFPKATHAEPPTAPPLTGPAPVAKKTQLLFTTDFEARLEEGRAGRVAGCLERIHEAADNLSFGLDPATSPDELALECLRADLRILAD